jgi:hypothetical protein
VLFVLVGEGDLGKRGRGGRWRIAVAHEVVAFDGLIGNRKSEWGRLAGRDG